jgi:hypothetical protein
MASMQRPRLKPPASIWKRIDSSPERLISLSALAVAFGALCVSFWQLDMAKQHNVLSVRPYLMVTPHLAGANGKNGLYLTNEGIGLGILTSLSVSVSGRVYAGLGKNQWPKILHDMGLEPLCFSIGWPTKVAALRPGMEIEILGKSKLFNSGCELALATFLTTKDVSIELRYTSLYEEEHKFSGDTFLNL